MTVKGELRNLIIALEGTPTKNTIPGLLGEISGILGGSSEGKTVAEQVHNIAVAKGYDPDPEPTVTYTVTYNVNGGTGSVEAAEVEAGESVTLDDGSNLTAPEGKEFSGWGITDDATEAVVSPFTPEADTILYAIWADAEPEPGE